LTFHGRSLERRTGLRRTPAGILGRAGNFPPARPAEVDRCGRLETAY
jgi:hypothetical protein